MYRAFLVLAGLVAAIGPAFSQQNALDKMLQTIEANNQSLDAFRKNLEARMYEFKTTNNLPDPQASAYYMPFGNNNAGDYTEFEISQRVEFPTVYSARADWISSQETKLEYQYRQLRQDILLEAKKLTLNWIHLQKQQILVKQRVEQSGKVYEQVQTLFDKGQMGILELNKAKIVWLDQQFAMEELETEQRQIEQELKGLNGGAAISLNIESYPDDISIASEDSLWKNRLSQDAQIQALNKQQEVGQQKVKVEKNRLLPDITAGYNYQGVAGNNFSGFYGGISIPLWNGRNKVKMAEAQVNYYHTHKNAVVTKLKSNYQNQYDRYQVLLNKFREYQMALEELNSESLLQKTYELGEISFMEYYLEVSFYRDAENRMLQMENELHQLKAELLKHRL